MNEDQSNAESESLFIQPNELVDMVDGYEQSNLHEGSHYQPKRIQALHQETFK